MSAHNSPNALRSRALPVALLLIVLIAVAVIALVIANRHGSTVADPGASSAADTSGTHQSQTHSGTGTSTGTRHVQGSAKADQQTAARKAARAAAARAKARHTRAVRQARAASAGKGITYTVKKGDNLTVIAAWFHEHGYGRLYQLNRSVIGANPDLIYPGQKITITPGHRMTIHH